MGPMDITAIGAMVPQIAGAMLAGVWYVGVVGDLFQKLLIKIFSK